MIYDCIYCIIVIYFRNNIFFIKTQTVHLTVMKNVHLRWKHKYCDAAFSIWPANLSLRFISTVQTHEFMINAMLTHFPNLTQC